MRNVNEKISNFTGTWLHHKKSASLIVRSHRNRFQSTVCGAILLCNYNQV